MSDFALSLFLGSGVIYLMVEKTELKNLHFGEMPSVDPCTLGCAKFGLETESIWPPIF